MYAEATKVCNGPLCQGQEKPFSDFNRSKASADGLQSFCRACDRHSHAAWRQTPEGRASQIRRSAAWKALHPAAFLLKNCRTRAKTKGIECSLTLEWVEQKLLAGVCEVTGIAFVTGVLRHPFQPSIDRIDSSKGYTPENCRIVLWFVNTAKHTLAEDDFQSALRQVAEAVVERC